MVFVGIPNDPNLLYQKLFAKLTKYLITDTKQGKFLKYRFKLEKS